MRSSILTTSVSGSRTETSTRRGRSGAPDCGLERRGHEPEQVQAARVLECRPTIAAASVNVAPSMVDVAVGERRRVGRRRRSAAAETSIAEHRAGPDRRRARPTPAGSSDCRARDGARTAPADRTRRRAAPRRQDAGTRVIAAGRRASSRRRGRAGVALERQLDDPEAHVGEVMATGRRHRREQADRRESRDRVDLGHDDPFAGEQEVDPGEAVRPDRPVDVARELVEHGPLDVAHLGARSRSPTGRACTSPRSRRTRARSRPRPGRRPRVGGGRSR